MIAALFVAAGGTYYNLPDVDPWGLPERDARLYAGPHPVVAHPPCERWGRYAKGGPNPNARRREVGDDGGCFASALASVRAFEGVLEHPEASYAWSWHGLAEPSWRAGWIPAGDGGYTCCVAQGNYGHSARKLTWLYAHGCELPELDWSIPKPRPRLDRGFHSKAERAAHRGRLPVDIGQRLTTAENIATPPAFRDLLLSIARTAQARAA